MSYYNYKDSYNYLLKNLDFNFIKSNKQKLESIVSKIKENLGRYKNVSILLTYENYIMPPPLIGIIHLLESNLNFKTHLHNGDPLTARTVHIPKGRPPVGEPPFSWEESAFDALEIKLNDMRRAGDYLDFGELEQWLYFLEKYNGFGYRKRGINSPYLWAGTNHYTKGKYVSDGVFDPEAVSKQVGAVPIIVEMILEDIIKINFKDLKNE
jgi:lysozyme family protein